MPWALKLPCRQFACYELVEGGGYCPRHAEERRKLNYRGSSHKQGYGARWRRLRSMVLNRQPLCRICHAPATDVDHILPRRSGGRDTFENLQSLCHSCHSRKTVSEGAWR